QAGEIYEKLWFSGWLEDEKKVLTLFLPHSENATAEGDATIDALGSHVDGSIDGLRPKLASTSMDACMWNDPQKTTELFSFGWPKEEKLKSHHHPQREATAPT
ncbi:hypothetical protein Taro_050094, partial [Colocasia esculenta]|nr:hypothetical protein [Colocasia esculenta]